MFVWVRSSERHLTQTIRAELPLRRSQHVDESLLLIDWQVDIPGHAQDKELRSRNITKTFYLRAYRVVEVLEDGVFDYITIFPFFVQGHGQVCLLALASQSGDGFQ